MANWFGIDIDALPSTSGYGKEQLKVSKATYKAILNYMKATNIPNANQLYNSFMSYYISNMKFYKQLDRKEFNKLLKGITGGFVEVTDVNNYINTSGVFILVLGKYKQVYIGQSRYVGREVFEYFDTWVKHTHYSVRHTHAKGLMSKIDAEDSRKNSKGLTELVCDYGRLPIQAFRPFDVTKIYIKPMKDDRKELLCEEHNLLMSIDDKFLCNISKGDDISNTKYGTFGKRSFTLDFGDTSSDKKEANSDRATYNFYGIKVSKGDNFNGIPKLIGELLDNEYRYVSNLNDLRVPGVFVLVYDKDDRVYIGTSNKNMKEAIISTWGKIDIDKCRVTRILAKCTDDPYSCKKTISIDKEYLLNKR